MIGLPVYAWLDAKAKGAETDGNTEQLATGLYITFAIALCLWICIVCCILPCCRYYRDGDSQAETAPFLPQKVDRPNTIVYPL